MDKIEEYFDENSFGRDIILINEGLESYKHFFAIKIFLDQIRVELIDSRLGVLSADSENCAVENPNVLLLIY